MVEKKQDHRSMVNICRHCFWGNYPSGFFPSVPLTECPCRCHEVDPKPEDKDGQARTG